jgi:hypothetical protein
MTASPFQEWLDIFTRSWQTNDPDVIGSLVPDEFEWHSSPFGEIFRDRKTLVDHWVSTVRAHDSVEAEYEIYCDEPGRGVARIRASYLLHKTSRDQVDGIIQVHLDRDGRATLYQEWWVTSRTSLPDYAN